MEKKKTLILLFMFVFAGVTLLGHTPALAVDKCSEAEKAAYMCVETIQPTINKTPSEQIPVYVVRAVGANGTYPVNQPGGLNPWPFNQNGFTVFRYMAGVFDDALTYASHKPKPWINKPASWSYIVLSLWEKPLDSDPPGADLRLDQLPNACGPQAIAPNHIAWKLNPGINFSNKINTFDLITPLGTKIDQCAAKSTEFPTLLAITSSDCPKLPGLNVPAGEISVPFQHWAHFTCDDSGINVNVEFDECTGGVKEVRCDTLGAECSPVLPPLAVPFSNPYGYVPVPGYQTDPISFPILNIGPGTPGVVVCTGADNQPVYLRGDKGWWCPPAP